jgi:hypothetical protein
MIDVSVWPQGFYFVRIAAANDVEVMRFVKQKFLAKPQADKQIGFAFQRLSKSHITKRTRPITSLFA